MAKLTDKTKELVRTAMRIWRESTAEGKIKMQDGANTTIYLANLRNRTVIEVSRDRLDACLIFLRLVSDWRWLTPFSTYEDRFKNDNLPDAHNYVTQGYGVRFQISEGFKMPSSEAFKKQLTQFEEKTAEGFTYMVSPTPDDFENKKFEKQLITYIPPDFDNVVGE